MRAITTRDEASCPSGNGTNWTSDDGSQYELYCDFDFNGYDLPATPVSSFSDCINSCSKYSMNEASLNGANCVAAVFGAADPNGNPCWLKSQIQSVQTGGYMIYAARRIQYQIGSPAVYTSFKASAPSPTQSPAAAPTSPSFASHSTIVAAATQAQADESTPTASVNETPSLVVSTVIIVSSGGSTSQTSGEASLLSGAPSAAPSISIATVPPPSSGSGSQTSSALSASVTRSIDPGGIAGSQSPSTLSSVISIASQGFNSSSGSSTSNISTDSGLSLGAKVGIGVSAGILLVLLLAFLIFCLGSRRREQSRSSTNAGANAVPGTKLAAQIVGGELPSKPYWRGVQELPGDGPSMTELDTRPHSAASPAPYAKASGSNSIRNNPWN